jgi:hypothetical protein
VLDPCLSPATILTSRLKTVCHPLIVKLQLRRRPVRAARWHRRWVSSGIGTEIEVDVARVRVIWERAISGRVRHVGVIVEENLKPLHVLNVNGTKKGQYIAGKRNGHGPAFLEWSVGMLVFGSRDPRPSSR